jgi:hypothetical protein
MEACVDLFRGPRSTPWQATGRPVAGQLSGTPLRAVLTHLRLRVPVLGSRGLSPSRSPGLQMGPQSSLW